MAGVMCPCRIMSDRTFDMRNSGGSAVTVDARRNARSGDTVAANDTA